MADYTEFPMGVVNHNAIVVTTWSDDRANELQSWIDRLSDRDQQLIVRAGSWVNGQHSFFVAPDGSKEGRPDSDGGDRLRDRIVERLAVDDYEDGSSPWSWVEVGFGEYGQKVIRGNCVNCYNDADYAVVTEAEKERTNGDGSQPESAGSDSGLQNSALSRRSERNDSIPYGSALAMGAWDTLSQNLGMFKDHCQTQLQKEAIAWFEEKIASVKATGHQDDGREPPAR